MAKFSNFARLIDAPIDKTQYISNDHLKLLRLWKRRVHRYFPQVDQKALDYRVNDNNTGVKVLKTDGTIVEITIDKSTDVAMMRICPSDEQWSFKN